ncbi:hypothetical protein [Pseudoduganella chitinolytica]|uniref:Meckel syndrome type 1 protein n=1 Tax=Pseudoduganella chitinolytica TaxID=34070 RepID=A0ABY8BFD5_9BURK|nr:hypothetical protein [Pseudoduganella chitinolytica]WEF34617.1 hypothetical protein PX653_07600 [Pseudoduganella chitinolytica]
MEPTTTPVEESGPAVAAPPGTAGYASQRWRAVWLAVTLAVVAVVGSAAWLANVVSTERALHAVTSAGLPVAPAPTAAALPAAAPAEPPEVAVAALGAAGGAAIAAGAMVPTPAPAPAPAPAPTAAVEPRPADMPAAQPPNRGGHQSKAVRTRTGKRAAARQAAKRKPESATFRRCPPLGRPGAVMCRWHICNGGAGKEAVCRPYLERRP